MSRNEVTSSRAIPIQKIIDFDVAMPTEEEYGYLLYNDKIHSDIEKTYAYSKQNKVLNVAEHGVVPYDRNRVELKSILDETNYINASWIKEPGSDPTYDIAKIFPYLPLCQIGLICTQMPNEEGMDRYHQMMLENKIGFAIHFSHSVEPLNLAEYFDKSSISRNIISKQELKDYLDKENWEIDNNDEMVHGLKYFRFKGWPASGCLNSDTIRKILTTISLIRNEIGVDKSTVNMVVHDDHGGSSAAAIFISLLFLLEQIDGAMLSDCISGGKRKNSQSVDIFQTVNSLRKKRMKMIKSMEEYKFLYQCTMYYVHHKQDYDELIKPKEDKTVNTSIVNQKPVDSLAHAKTDAESNDDILSEYVMDETYSDPVAVLMPTEHVEGDYFDGYKVYS